MDVEATLYDLLGVSSHATADEIKLAFRRCARRYHPDANPDSPSAAEHFKEVAAAYETLGDPTRRADYDAELATRAEMLGADGMGPGAYDGWGDDGVNGTAAPESDDGPVHHDVRDPGPAQAYEPQPGGTGGWGDDPGPGGTAGATGWAADDVADPLDPAGSQGWGDDLGWGDGFGPAGPGGPGGPFGDVGWGDDPGWDEVSARSRPAGFDGRGHHDVPGPGDGWDPTVPEYPPPGHGWGEPLDPISEVAPDMVPGGFPGEAAGLIDMGDMGDVDGDMGDAYGDPTMPPPTAVGYGRLPLGIGGRIVQILLVLAVMWVVDGIVGASMANLADAAQEWWDADRAQQDVDEDPEASDAQRRRALAATEDAAAELRSETIRVVAIPVAGLIAWPAAHLLLRPRRQPLYYY